MAGTIYTATPLHTDTASNLYVSGTMGVGTAITSSRWVGIAAATSSRAQMNLASSGGVNPSSPANGDLWWNGTNLYFRTGSSTVDLLVGSTMTGSLFTDGGATTYLTSVSDNLALGGSSSTSPFFFDATNQLLTLTNTTSGLSFRVNDETSDTTPFVIDASGNVGIGTATPGAKLDIGGAASIISNTSGDITINPASGTVSFSGASLSNVLNATLSGNLIVNGGNVGIGNTSPGSRLQVSGGDILLNDVVGQNATRIKSYNSGASLWLLTPTTTSYTLFGTAHDWDTAVGLSYGPGTIGAGTGLLRIGQLQKNNANFTHGVTALYTNGLERMRIDSSGRVGIGVTSPTQMLDVAGSINTNGGLLTGTIVDAMPSNLIYNGNIETDTSGWVTNLATASRQAPGFYGGYSLRLVYSGSGDNYATYTLPVISQTLANRSYTFSFWARADSNGTFTSTPRLQETTGYTDACVINDIVLTTSWKKFKATCTWGAGISSTGWRVVLRTTGNASNHVYYDGISVQNGTSGTEYNAFSTSDTGNTIFYDGNIGIGDATPDTKLKVVGSLCVKSDGNNCAGSTAGTIYANNTSVQSADLAESYRTSDMSVSNGDILSVLPDGFGEVIKANISNSDNIIGVVSTSPGITMNAVDDETFRPVGLVGKVPVKVFKHITNIDYGDPIGASVINGVGYSDRDEVQTIVGRALENTYDWDNTKCTSVSNINSIIWPKDNGDNSMKPCFSVPVSSFTLTVRNALLDNYGITDSETIYVGKIMAYVNPGYYQPDWISSELADIVNEFKDGNLGSSGYWSLDSNTSILTSNYDIGGNSFNANYGRFAIINGGIMNLSDGNFTVDSLGNTSIAGDILLAGVLKGTNGNILAMLGDSAGLNAFEIKNNNGETVFKVDSLGVVAGKGVYRSGWILVPANSNTVLNHQLNMSPSNITLVISNNSNGTNFTTRGVGSDYYYENVDDNNVRLVNTTNTNVYIKTTLYK